MASGSLTLRSAALVFVGGAAGTAVRALILVPDTHIWSALAVPLINMVGAFLLGLLTGRLARSADSVRSREARLLLGTGALGGFTTYSSLAVGAMSLSGFGIALATVIVGTAAAWVGLRLGRRERRSS